MNKQHLFDAPKEQCTIQNVGSSTGKTYRAIRHDIVRAKQKQNDNEVHHPDEKINQIKNVFAELEWDNKNNPKILERSERHSMRDAGTYKF